MQTFNKKISPNKKIKEINFKKIYLKKVSYAYDTNSPKKVFDGLDLDINKNETIGIMGSSGSGKSTLLDLICGILSPTNGKIFLEAANPNYQPIVLDLDQVSIQGKLLAVWRKI